MDTTTIESGKQATLEDLIEWRHITDHWVKRSCSTETNDAICPSWFYLEFCKLCRQTILIKESSLAEFLQSHFPDFELVLSADGNVLLMDSVYVCSLLLYFSCVRYPVAYLRNVCKQFDESQQQRIKTFFKHFLTGRKINRGFLDSAIFNAVRSTPIAKQTPKWDDGLATPDSPHELHYKNKNLDQQLKTALAENASLEKQNEQLQKELHDLNEKNKRLVLRLEVLEEAGSDRNGKETLLEVTDFNTVYLRKQLIEKDEQLERLEAEMCVLKTKEENFKNDHGRLGFENRALQEEITSLQSRLQVATVEFEKVEGNNQLLRDQLLEFERYIDGNRVVFPPEILDSSNDFLNMSSNITLNQSCSPDGESLASSVVEVMLQEAKTQNQQLQSKLNQLEKELKFAKEQNMLNTETNNQLGQQTLLVQAEMIDLETRHHMALNAEKTETAKLPVALEEKSNTSRGKHLQEVDSFQNERDELITKMEELSSALEKEKLCSAEWKLKWEEKDSDYRQTVDNLRKEKQGLIDEIKEMSAALEKEKLCSAEWKLKWEEKDYDHRQTVEYLQMEKEALIKEIEELGSTIEKKWKSKDNEQCMQASSYVQQIRVLQEEQDAQAKKLQKHQTTYTTIKEEMETALETKKLQGVLEQQTINEVEYDRKLSDFQKKVQELYVSLESNKTHNTQLQVNLDEREEKLQEYEQQINYLQNKLADVESQCINLIKQNSVQQNELFEKARKNEELCNNLTAMHKKMQQIQEMLARSNRSVQQDGESLQQRQRNFSDPVTQASAEQIKELQAKYEKYYHDCEILSAKLYKERLANEKWKAEMIAIRESYDQEKRATCISYEESMEKMKERMKRLHKDSKDALEHSYKEKLVQLEVRCAQLQEQLAEKNERDLAIRKENQVLLAKVKTLEENKLERNGRFLLPAPAQACLRNNLRMEDEEGELFNATYLADLQVGRCWSPGADTVRYSEILQRNSMVPPHLRTNYGTMYPDCDVVASDTPDSISEGFDDSSTGLITRRKVSGTTSYKRPGPPTPSKKAGRVSFGGILPISNNQVQYKEALKNRNANSARSSSATTTSHNHSDPLINDAKTAGRTKTPGKFKQMLSSSNLLGNFNQRNENSPPKRRVSWFSKGAR